MKKNRLRFIPWVCLLVILTTTHMMAQEIDDFLAQMPKLAPEQDIIGLTPAQPLPDTAHKDYLVINDTCDADNVLFNHREQEVHNIEISGVHIVIEPGNPNNLYELLNEKDNIKSLKIFAETLTIKSELLLPQTNVSIWARELNFIDPSDPDTVACINTTPLYDTSTPEEATDGKDGHDAGDITVNIQRFNSTPEGEVRFILNGGHGQKAGLGKDGSKGSNATSGRIFYSVAQAMSDWIENSGISADEYPLYDSPFLAFYRSDIGKYVIGHPVGTGSYATGYYWEEIGNQETGTIYIEQWVPLPYRFSVPLKSKPTKIHGEKQIAENGGNATAPGKPGEPGNGGTFSSTLVLWQYVTSSAGLPGDPGSDNDATPEIYEGGAPGYPRTATYKYLLNTTVIKTESFTSYPGENAPIRFANLSQGKDGDCFLITGGEEITWLHPNAIRQAIKYGKDAYLYGYLPEAKEIFDSYIKLISMYADHPRWSDLDDITRMQLLQLKSELTALSTRISLNLDYYGNPAGWVPLVSFEVTRQAYDNQITNALKMFYFAYVVKNKNATMESRIQGLMESQKALLDDVKQKRINYNTAAQDLAGLSPLAQDIETDIENINNSIEALMIFIEEKARQQVIDSHKKEWWESLLSKVGEIAKVMPFFQPICGTIGNTLINLSEGSFEAAYNNVLKVPDSYNDTVKHLGKLQDNLDLDNFNFEGDLDDIVVNNADEAGTFFKTFYDEGVDFYNFIMDRETTGVPQDEVTQVMNQMLSESEDFQQLIADLEELLNKKREYSVRLDDVVNKLTSIPNQINMALLTIAVINTDLQKNRDIIHPDTLNFIENMENQARESLNKFHYYFAKAYEYRFLKPYPGDLNIERIYNKIRDLYEATASGGILTSEDFEQLELAFRSELLNITNAIYELNDEQDAMVERKKTVRFELSNDLLSQLNNEGSVQVNFKESGLFLMEDENYRIKNIDINDIQYTVDTDPGSFGYMEINLEHSGISNFAVNGKYYQFRHYRKTGQNPLRWGNRIELDTGIITPIQPSAASKSLLRSITGLGDEDLILFSRPSCWADFTITKIQNTQTPDVAVNINFIELSIEYDTSEQSDTLIELAIRQPDSGITPLIELDTPDVNGRTDGMDFFYRSYEISYSKEVVLTAPEQYGEWVFSHWKLYNSQNQSLPVITDGAAQNRIIVFLDQNQIVQPVYILNSDNLETTTTKSLPTLNYSASFLETTEMESNTSWDKKFTNIERF